ncbi:MAG TPA: GNAT family N-acetyltransferase [Acholeplasma sp.]|nr:GNAT family N-acetyltransferase [Acholeplasma sp.]
MKTIKTKRLIIRKPKMKDVEDIFEYSKTEFVGPIAGWLPHKDINETKSILKQFIKSEDVWVIELKSIKKVIGTISLTTKSYYDLINDIYELGYAINHNYWQQGFASEAAKAMIDFAFKDLKVQKLICAHDESNVASRKIIEKNQFELIKIDNNPKYSSNKIKKVYIYELYNPYRGENK